MGFVARSFVFSSLIALALFNSLFAMSYLTLLPVFADSYFGAGSAGYGWLSAAHGAGALCATFTVATIAHLIRRKGVTLLVGAACLGLVLMGFLQSPGMWLALPLLVLVGFCNTFYLMQVSTYLQQEVPDHLRGRVMSIYMLAFRGGMPLGSLVGGWLTNQFTAPPVLMMNGTILALAATWFLVKGHAVREL